MNLVRVEIESLSLLKSCTYDLDLLHVKSAREVCFEGNNKRFLAQRALFHFPAQHLRAPCFNKQRRGGLCLFARAPKHISVLLGRVVFHRARVMILFFGIRAFRNG